MPDLYDSHGCPSSDCTKTISKASGLGYCKKHQKVCKNGHKAWVMRLDEDCSKCGNQEFYDDKNKKKDQNKKDEDQAKQDKKRNKENEFYKERKDARTRA
jgi:hypothetical protein